MFLALNQTIVTCNTTITRKFYSLDAELGHDKLTLERFSLTLASPDTEDKGHLDAWQVHEVLGNMDDQLVHEGRCDVKTILHVVELETAKWSRRKLSSNSYNGFSYQ
jgi:hypothetical protein